MRAALGFLTVLGGARTPTPTALRWFPLVGLVVGALTGGAWWLAGEVWPPLVAAVVVVGVDLALTGLLHADGLADTADGLLAQHAGRDRRLEIMRTPDVGAYGVAVTAMVLLARVAGLAAIVPAPFLVVGLWVTSRSVIAVVPARVPYARPEGLASTFLGAGTVWAPLAGVAVGVGLAAATTGWAGLGAATSVVVVAVLVVGAARRRLGGFTGDVLGAAVLAGETAGLLVAAGRW